MSEGSECFSTLEHSLSLHSEVFGVKNQWVKTPYWLFSPLCLKRCMAVELDITNCQCHIQCYTAYIYSHLTLSQKCTLFNTHIMACRHLRHSEITHFWAGTALCLGFWLGGLLVTFEQPFQLPRAEQAQGGCPTWSQWLKMAVRDICYPTFLKTNFTPSTVSLLTEVSIYLQMTQNPQRAIKVFIVHATFYPPGEVMFFLLNLHI